MLGTWSCDFYPDQAIDSTYIVCTVDIFDVDSDNVSGSSTDTGQYYHQINFKTYFKSKKNIIFKSLPIS